MWCDDRMCVWYTCVVVHVCRSVMTLGAALGVFIENRYKVFTFDKEYFEEHGTGSKGQVPTVYARACICVMAAHTMPLAPCLC